MDKLTTRILNDYQRDFSLAPQPFEAMASSLGTSTENLLQRLGCLKKSGAISRVGPVFRPNTVGVSTLLAMAVESVQLESVALIINGFAQVNHNYQREHYYNLWFVVTAESQDKLKQTLAQIEQKTNQRVLVLPMLKDYHIDLGFNMQLADSQAYSSGSFECYEDMPEEERSAPGDLVEAIQAGLPLVETPYKAIGKKLGWSEKNVIDTIHNMLETGDIKRLGVVVRHHELGYHANAMVVWDVNEASIDRIGFSMGQQDCVRLCYQRPRHLPQWPYNLFCMVHGKDRHEVLGCVNHLIKTLNLQQNPHEVLFSIKRYKQRGAHYRVRH